MLHSNYSASHLLLFNATPDNAPLLGSASIILEQRTAWLSVLYLCSSVTPSVLERIALRQ